MPITPTINIPININLYPLADALDELAATLDGMAAALKIQAAKLRLAGNDPEAT